MKKYSNPKQLTAATSLVLMMLLISSCTRPSPKAQTSTTLGNTTISIDYSQPAVKGRKIWGELVPYEQVWRTGANEATTFTVNQDVRIEGQQLSAGKYALFTIPKKDEWIIIFNREADQWGAEEYDAAQDALRVSARPKKAPQFTERLTFNIDKNGTVSMLWEEIQVDFEVDTSQKTSNFTSFAVAHLSRCHREWPLVKKSDMDHERNSFEVYTRHT